MGCRLLASHARAVCKSPAALVDALLGFLRCLVLARLAAAAGLLSDRCWASGVCVCACNAAPSSLLASPMSSSVFGVIVTTGHQTPDYSPRAVGANLSTVLSGKSPMLSVPDANSA